MKTLVYIRDLLLKYADRMEAFQIYNADDIGSIRSEFISNMQKLKERFPHLLYSTCSAKMSKEEATIYIKHIKDAIRNCYYPIIPISFFSNTIGNDIIETPKFLDFSEWDSCIGIQGETTLNSFLVSLLLAVPIGKIKFTIIDLEEKLDIDFLYKQINSQLYNHKPITKEQELLELLDRVNKRILDTKQKNETYSQYCQKNKQIPIPYEFIILTDNNAHNYSNGAYNFCQKRLESAIKNSYIAGIYFINLTGDSINISEFPDAKSNKRKTRKILEYVPIIKNANLLEACIDYINTEVNVKEESMTITCDFTSQVEIPYDTKLEEICVPVGKSDKEVHFRMDLVNHVHSFIIGQSGSGKSVFLHNIIGSAILKYAPEDLQLYLLDFKLGGVEFNRYRGIKHVKSLLVDNSDQQITLEILRELRDSMVERGKQLREAGVSNLSEYNKMNPTKTLPQILLIVDECHEMFRIGNDIPRAISNEITEIVTKIAKEGRSQGVHLVLATQTLSGTEISSEILNNISDHYLLKCALADSEHLVEGSSEITSKLTTGQIYYHHVDSQIQFQAYYMDKQNAEKQIELAKEKAEGHKSNGEFYFNGSQLFKLDRNILEQSKPSNKYLTAYAGKNISIRQNDISIKLRKDYSENILLLGLNDEEQVTRTTMNVFLSLLFSVRSANKDIPFKVLDCLSNEDSIYSKQLERLEEEGYCEIIEGRKNRGVFLKKLAEEISNGTAKEAILFILGQERFRELKMDWEINEPQKQDGDEAFGFGNFSFGGGDSSTQINTCKQAMEVRLEKGAEQGVHVIMQLDKPSNFLFSDYVTSKMVYSKFKHLIMLKSEETASAILHLNDNIRLETLSKDSERLRAYYYAEESDSYTLFTPYQQLNEDEIMDLLK